MIKAHESNAMKCPQVHQDHLGLGTELLGSQSYYALQGISISYLLDVAAGQVHNCRGAESSPAVLSHPR